MSALLNFLKENSNWRDLLLDLHIKIKEKDNYALFKYEIDADFFNPIVQDARGTIVNLDTMEIVCYPFRKFGNFGEPYADTIDWQTAKVQEKLDGSIIKLWYDGTKWRLSTNNTIDAFSCKNSEGYNFGDMAVSALINQREDFFTYNNTNLDKDYTYIFELTSPNNQIVVQYNETKIYHIGTRHNKTGQEINTNIGIEKPKEYGLSSLDACINFVSSFDGSEHEGFVVVDANYNRVKVKAPDYIRLHHMAGNTILSLDKALDLILNNEVGEYLTYFPSKKDYLNELDIKIKYETAAIASEILDFKMDGDIPSRKDFALKYHNHPHFSFYMDTLYKDNPLIIPKKYWLKFFK